MNFCALSAAVLAAVSVLLSCSTFSLADEATVVDRPPTSPANTAYVVNRAPLSPSVLVKLPPGSIRPEGWLRTQLELMSNGLTGRLTELSPWCQIKTSAWASPTGEGKNGWEEVPYWLKGFGDLGYVLHDQRITAEAKHWIDGVLASSRADGYFGPRLNIGDKKPNETGPAVNHKLDLWPNMVMLNVLQDYYEATHDERVIQVMTAYFHWQLSLPAKDILPGYWDKMRGGDNLASIYWLYNRTGDPVLLDAAKRVHECTARWRDGVINWHGVNVAQGYREPAIWFQQSHEPSDLAAAERNYQEFRHRYGQVPGGLFGSDENARPGYVDPRQGTETCTMVEFMHSQQMLLGISGDPVLADRCEDVAFNSFPASHTPDLKALHYLTAPNQVQLDRADHHPGIENGGDMFSYDPRSYRCCQHNAAMGWPYYAEHLFMATAGNGLAAILYSSSSVTAKVGLDATEVKLAESTDYPFDPYDTITFTLSTPRDVKFPLMLRIPGWCTKASLSINDQPQQIAGLKPLSYAVLDRTWKDGDHVVLKLPMDVSIRTWEANKNAVSVDYGPLTFSLKIGEQWKPYWSDKDWTASEVFPTTPWNYALELDPKNPRLYLDIERRIRKADQPFSVDAAPITITAHARRVPGWTTDNTGLLNPLPQSPVVTGEPVESVTLIPMGCARLRISAFPVVAGRPWPIYRKATTSRAHRALAPR